jgi:hypothetical protein
MVEPDIDYFRDLGAHAIFEVIPNAITHSLTNPVEVYVFRWIAGQTAGIPEFDPQVRHHVLTGYVVARSRQPRFTYDQACWGRLPFGSSGRFWTVLISRSP